MERASKFDKPLKKKKISKKSSDKITAD